MAVIHVVLGVLGAAAIVLGAAWAAWPAPQTDPSSVRLLAFPYVVHGAVLGATGFAVALWCVHAIRREQAGAVLPALEAPH